MLSLIIALIFIILIAGVGYWAVTRVGEALGLPAPVIVIAQVLIAVAAIYAFVVRAGLAS